MIVTFEIKNVSIETKNVSIGIGNVSTVGWELCVSCQVFLDNCLWMNPSLIGDKMWERGRRRRLWGGRLWRGK
ncbi:MAG TPA: hypothetical protein PLK38_05025, partial [Methanoregulaceae archaeon]|nr:hypothetical protein [Methanoregulaceae archaeon]